MGTGLNHPRLLRYSASSGEAPTQTVERNDAIHMKCNMPNLASQMRVASLQHGLENSSNSPDEREMICSTSRGRGLLLQRLGKVLPRVREFAPVFFELLFQMGRGLRVRPTGVLAFVPVERSLRPPVRLFAPLRDKVTSSAQSLVPFRPGPAKDQPCQS